jgi:hypothetical protein
MPLPALPPAPPLAVVPPAPAEHVSGQYLPDAAGIQTPHSVGPQQR